MRGDQVRFLLGDAAVMRDPYPAYRELRKDHPIVRGGPGQWVIARHADVSVLLKDRTLSRDFPPAYQAFSIGEGSGSDFLRRIIIDRDPPDHSRVRRLLTQAMSPRFVRQLDGLVRALADRSLAAARERGSFDAVQDLAVPVPMMMMSELFGIPDADREYIRLLSVDLSATFAVFIPEEKKRRAHAAVDALREYFSGLIIQRRRQPGDDMISRMVLASRDGSECLSDEEIVDNAIFVYYAGFETTTNLVATGCAVLASQPEVQRQLRADQALMPTAIEEFLRFDAPIHATTRMATQELEIHGQRIRPGRVLVLLLASANRDEQVFDEPDSVDLARHPNPHVSFGGGVHHCIGAALARVEGTAVFSRLLDTFAELTIADTTDWAGTEGGFRYPYYAWQSLPITAS